MNTFTKVLTLSTSHSTVAILHGYHSFEVTFSFRIQLIHFVVSSLAFISVSNTQTCSMLPAEKFFLHTPISRLI